MSLMQNLVQLWKDGVHGLDGVKTNVLFLRAEHEPKLCV